MGDLGRNLLAMQRLSDAVEKEEERLKQHDKDMDLMVCVSSLTSRTRSGRGIRATPQEPGLTRDLFPSSNLSRFPIAFERLSRR